MFSRTNRRNREKSAGKQAVRQAICCITEPLERRVMLAVTPTLFVVNNGGAEVGSYNAANGATITDPLISGFNNPYGIAVSGSNLYVTDAGNGTVGEYTTTGAVVNANLVTGLVSPQGIVVSGGNLFVVDEGMEVVGEYNATTGAVVDATLITFSGGADVYGIAVLGSDLFITDQGNGVVGEYTTGGGTVAAALISGLDQPQGIAATASVAGSDLFITDETDGTVGKYNALTGATINANLVSGLSDPYGVTIVGPDLYVTDQNNDTVGEYNATTGAAVNASLVTGLGGPTGIVEASVAIGAPVITLNPTNQTVDVGDTATFTAAATGTPTPTVQWQLSTDGGTTFNNITGATSTTYSFSATAIENGYEYQAVFTNTNGSATTTAATLTVHPAGFPEVTLNPTDQSVPVGHTATFTAAATGTPTPTVQWDVSTDGGSTWNPIGGATSTTYSFSGATESETGYEYEAIFHNSLGSVTTTAATLTVVLPATVSGIVYYDLHDSGAKTGSDPRMAGITITIQKYKGKKATGSAQTITTSASGHYSYTVVNPMAGVTYQISVTAPSGDRITQPSGSVYALSLGSDEMVSGENFGLIHSKPHRPGPPSIAPFGPFVINSAYFIQAFDHSAGDPKLVTNFFGDGGTTLSPHGVYLTLDTTGNNGTNPTEDFANITINSPLRRSGKNLDKFTGWGTASVTIDNNPYTFTLRVKGSLYQSHASSWLKGEFYAVDVNNDRLLQGPAPIFDGSFSE